jgi:hypothetical protein
MASKKSDIDGADIAKSIAADLPGWTRASRKRVADEYSAIGHAAQGATLADLRRKFLGADATSDGPRAQADDFGSPSKGRTTISVQPQEGGPVKTADFANGRTKIVQG